MKRAQIKEHKRVEAQDRQSAYDALSTQEKYDRAVERGHENSREALRLRRELDKR